jgi:excisionase family DNA binding protein
MSENLEIECGTVRVWPEAGRRLGLGRNATYEAIARGEIPVIRFGRRIVVPKKALERLLNGEVSL